MLQRHQSVLRECGTIREGWIVRCQLLFPTADHNLDHRLLDDTYSSREKAMRSEHAHIAFLKVRHALVLVSVSTMNNGSGCVCVCTAALCNIQICLTIYSVLVYS